MEGNDNDETLLKEATVRVSWNLTFWRRMRGGRGIKRKGRREESLRIQGPVSSVGQSVVLITPRSRVRSPYGPVSSLVTPSGRLPIVFRGNYANLISPPLSPGGCWLTTSSSADAFCFCLQSFPVGWLFASGGQSV